METDPINPASSDSSPSMEIKSTEPIESGEAAAAPVPTDPVVANATTPLQSENKAPDPVTTQDPVVASHSTPAAAEPTGNQSRRDNMKRRHSEEAAGQREQERAGNAELQTKDWRR